MSEVSVKQAPKKIQNLYFQFVLVQLLPYRVEFKEGEEIKLSINRGMQALIKENKCLNKLRTSKSTTLMVAFPSTEPNSTSLCSPTTQSRSMNLASKYHVLSFSSKLPLRNISLIVTLTQTCTFNYRMELSKTSSKWERICRSKYKSMLRKADMDWRDQFEK